MGVYTCTCTCMLARVYNGVCVHAACMRVCAYECTACLLHRHQTACSSEAVLCMCCSTQVPVSKFHELRYNVAYVLKEMEDLEKRSILKLQD